MENDTTRRQEMPIEARAVIASANKGAVNPFIKLTTPDEMAIADERKQNEIKSIISTDSLTGQLRRFWYEARTHRARAFSNTKSIDMVLLDSERQRKGEYPSDLLSKIKKSGGSEAFVKITNAKCTQAAAWLKDTMSPTDDKPWSIEPSPLPSMSPEVEQSAEMKTQQWMQERTIPPTPEDIEKFTTIMYDQLHSEIAAKAKYTSERMEKLIDDQLFEGGFSKAFSEFLDDLVTYPYAVLKAPVFKNIPTIGWKQDHYSGTWSIERKEEIKPFVERVSPKNIYFSPNCDSVDRGYIFERHKLTRNEIQKLKDVPGYSTDNINKVLEEFGQGGLKEWVNYDWELDQIESKVRFSQATESSDILIDALEFHGSTQGKYLKEWGLKVDNLDENKEYEVCAILIGHHIIKAEISDDYLDKRPYFVTSWKKMPDSIYGQAIPQLMEHSQNAINSCRRASINNLALSSGPQVLINSMAIQNKDDLTSIVPFKAWVFADKGQNGNRPPIEFVNVPNNLESLMGYERYLRDEIDQDTDVPRFESGNNQNMQGAALTARGLSMLMGAATKIIRQVMKNIGEDVIIPMITRFYNYNMLYSEDEEVKGDLNIKVRDVNSLVNKEQNQQSIFEFMQFMLQSPQVMELVGQKSFVKMVREVTKKMHLPENILPTDEELDVMEKEEQQKQAQQAQIEQQQMQAQAQLAQAKAATETSKQDQITHGNINNAVAQTILKPEEARLAYQQLSEDKIEQANQPQEQQVVQ